jgi:2-C-methyl-D-erythritol 4-phosphate cytidylyltransferase/2-C-methyl-D-erythritol 2,4-cyclodiphosphate synthase
VPVGAIIVAAGRGDRMGSPVPKQLLDLGGRTMLQRSVATFDRHPAVAQIVVVLPSELVERGADLVGPTSRPCVVVAGGPRRQDSVAHGADALRADVDVVLVHDAARPFADSSLIDRVLDGVGRAGAAIPAIGVRDTVKRSAPGDPALLETIPRDQLWLAQTPQGFRRDLLDRAMVSARSEVTVTDESMLMERMGQPVAIVPGDERNIKVTTPEDLTSARGTLQAAVRIGTGSDLHRLVEGRRLVLAGVEVPFEKGPHAHSDGDVLSHAIADALFGAAAIGDIGRHFPDTDPAWRDAAGLDLLARAVAIVRQSGWIVSNIDATLLLERPKLAPLMDAIRTALAGTLGLPLDAVSVKAKTNEGVDAVGRGEAIAAHAAVVLRPAPPVARS